MTNPDDHYKNVRVVFPPVGHCIYCGDERDLSLEHIVPLGMNGLLELPSSSCPACARTTSDFERNVLRGVFYQYRLQNIPAKRRKKSRPTALVGKLDTPTGNVDVEVRIDDLFKGSRAMPVFEQVPGVLAGALPWRSYAGHVEAWVAPSDAMRSLKLGRPDNGLGMPLGVTWPWPFSRFLAKIAHGYAYALLGRNGFTPLLTNFIRSGKGTKPGYWVASRGGAKEGPIVWGADSREIYRVRLVQVQNAQGEPHIAVTLYFFGYHAPPQYLVIVGKPTQDTPEFAFEQEHAAWLAEPLPDDMFEIPPGISPPPMAEPATQRASYRPSDPWSIKITRE